jgi:outer membrane PBP1 activator LpoA protein
MPPVTSAPLSPEGDAPPPTSFYPDGMPSGAQPPVGGRVTPVRVALLLPLTGPDGTLGKQMLDAAELAVFDFGNDGFTLLSYDTNAVGGAVAAAQQALTDGAQLLIGPLFATEVAQVAPIARERGINVVSFSSDSSVAGNGVYIMGLPPSQGVGRVLSYAASQGMTGFAALLPDDQLGNRIGDAVQRAAGQLNATVVRVQTYPPGSDLKSLTPVVKQVADFDRRHAAVRDLQPTPAGRLTDARKRALALATTGDLGYSVLVLGESGQRLKTLSTLLAFYDIDPAKVRYVGTPQWEDASLGSEPELIGSWFAAPDPDARTEFDQHYQQAYGNTAPRLASLPYDAVGLAAVLARLAPGAGFPASLLSSPAGFLGADGVFRLGADGVIERGLAVYQIRRGGFTKVSPAPASFDQPPAL